jgi:hypothetical protein
MCPECEGKVIPIHYGHVDHATIERAIFGDIFIAEKYGLEKFYCKICHIKLHPDDLYDKIY